MVGPPRRYPATGAGDLAWAMSSPRLSALQRTAVGVASVRAGETARPDALFRDPLAAAFVAAAGGAVPMFPDSALRGALRTQIVLRTAFLDDALLAANRAGIDQVVLVGAGLDARLYRLDLSPGTVGFELDQVAMLDFKAAVTESQSATPRCQRVAVPCDLRTDWVTALAAAGFRPDRPTAWLVEGLLVYLEAAAARVLLARLTACSAPGSRLGFELGSGASRLAASARGAAEEALVALWRGGLGPDGPAWLAGMGWAVEVHPLDQVGVRYGRPLGRPSRSGLVSALRTGGQPGSGAAPRTLVRNISRRTPR